jgi:16S rRNA (adenine1518-N6/adenine1519-N6)-dimethyltransferase
LYKSIFLHERLEKVMPPVRPKKHLGQHFLTDQNIAAKIVRSLQAENAHHVLEIGPGQGVLTRLLLQQFPAKAFFIDVDTESIRFLQETYREHADKFIEKDFLSMNLQVDFPGPVAVIGNFPYNISSQLFFKFLDHRDQVCEIVCMVQKEVAQRLNAGPGSKTYGILSVLLQAYYDIQYLFTVKPGVFLPPPKVQSGVIRLKRNSVEKLGCDENLFFQTVKTAFNQRRKTLRNSLKPLLRPGLATVDRIFDKRPEQLSVEGFIEIVKIIS